MGDTPRSKRNRDTREQSVSPQFLTPEADSKKARAVIMAKSDSSDESDIGMEPPIGETSEQRTERVLTNLMKNSEKRTAKLVKNEFKSLKNDFRAKFDTIDKKQEELEAKLEQKSAKIQQLERSSRKKNVVVYGIPERKSENASERHDLIDDLCSKLKMAAIDYSEVYRLGKMPIVMNKSRPLLIKLVRFRDKITMFKAAAAEKPPGLSLSDDLTEEERKIRKILVTEKKRVKQANPEYTCNIHEYINVALLFLLML